MSFLRRIFNRKRTEPAPVTVTAPVQPSEPTKPTGQIIVEGFWSDKRLWNLKVGSVGNAVEDPALNRLTRTFNEVSDTDFFFVLKTFNECDGKPVSGSYLGITYKRGNDSYTFIDSGVRYSNE